MTKDLGNLDKALEARDSITNDLNEYQKMIDIGCGNIPSILQEYNRLKAVYSALTDKINFFKNSK